MTEDRLEAALTGWAAAKRLDEPERIRMRTEILLTPQVDAAWWARFDATMRRATSRAASAASGPGARWTRLAATSPAAIPVAWGAAST